MKSRWWKRESDEEWKWECESDTNVKMKKWEKNNLKKYYMCLKKKEKERKEIKLVKEKRD